MRGAGEVETVSNCLSALRVSATVRSESVWSDVPDSESCADVVILDFLTRGGINK